MFREVGNIYVRAFRMIFKHPQFLLLSIATTLVIRLNGFITSQMRTDSLLELRCLYALLSLIVMIAVSAGVPVAFILMTRRADLGLNSKEIFSDTKKYIWRYIGQTFAGAFLAFIFTLPFLCVFLITYSFLQNAFPFITWWFVFGYLILGAVGLGAQFLLDGDSGLFKNSMDGIRMLNGHFGFFATLYLIQIAIYLVSISLSLLIGSSITGADLTSISMSSLSTINEGFKAATQTPVVLVYNLIVQSFDLPVSAIVLTLAYLRYKNRDSLDRAIRQTQLSNG